MLILWVSVAVASLIVEIMTVASMSSIWFTVGALVALLLEILGVSNEIQIITFIFVSILTLIFIRPLAANYFRGNVVPTNNDRMIGKVLKVSEKITADKWGAIIINGIPWSAVEVDDLEVNVGEKVKIMAIEGVKLIVKKI